MTPTTCYILDDELYHVEYLTELVSCIPELRLAGSDYNPIRALAFLQEHPVGLVFLDINMNGMSGFEVAKRIHCPIIWISAYGDMAEKLAEFENTVGYLTKPVRLEGFRMAVRAALTKISGI